MGEENINAGNYLFDLDAIMDFVFESDTDRTTDSEIEESYVQDEETKEMVLSTKVLREVKGGDNTSKQTIRYDMIKMFIDNLLNIEYDSEIQPLSFGEAAILNTMAQKGMLKKINIENRDD